MRQLAYFNKDLAMYLLNMCDLTVEQFENSGQFKVPFGTKLVKSFKGIAFGHKEWFGFIIETWDSVIIAFRGTQSDPDWIADAEASQNVFPFGLNFGSVHHGFLSIYHSIREEIFKTYAKTPPYKKLYVTGHSLGAALATLHAIDAANNSHFPNITMYNFGSPRVGDQQFARQYHNLVPNSIRFANTDDIIPMLPPRNLHCPFTKKYWDYRHITKKIAFSIQKGSIHGNHSTNTYREGINGLK